MSEPPPLPQQKSGGCERTLTFALIGAASLGFIGVVAGLLAQLYSRPKPTRDRCLAFLLLALSAS